MVLDTLKKTMAEIKRIEISKAPKASDWEYAGIAAVGGSFLVQGGAWIFAFRSQAKNLWGEFIVFGAGIAIQPPGVSFEIGMPSAAAEDLSWSPIVCKRPFSLAELDGADATLLNGGASALMVGYSQLYASASISAPPPAVIRAFSNSIPFNIDWKESLFEHQLNDGWSMGVDLSIGGGFSAARGRWQYIGSTLVKNFLIPVGKGVIAGASVATGLYQAGEALLEGRAEAILQCMALGYADMLTHFTSEFNQTWLKSEMPRIERLLRVNVTSTTDSLTQQYQKAGSTLTGDLTAKAVELGEAKAAQQINNYITFKGYDAWEKVRTTHRSLYGAVDGIRKDRYHENLKKLIKDGKTELKIALDV